MFEITMQASSSFQSVEGPALHAHRLRSAAPAALSSSLQAAKDPNLREGPLIERTRPVCQCAALSGEAQFERGIGSVHFSSRDSEGLAAVPGEVKRKYVDWTREVRRLSSQLRSYGAAGILAYGILNTLYYSAAFLVVWLYFVKVPKGLGWTEVGKQFAAVMSIAWAASQVTKVPRVALAVFLAPVADGSLVFLQARLRLRTRRNATLVVVAICLLLAAAVFGLTMALWA